MTDWNNVNGVCCKPWLVLPAVYSDALSYGDQMAQFCSALNKVIQNNNNLPDYVQQMIQEYISGGIIGEIVQSVIAEFILNVKYPPDGLAPAVGDGSADDTAAIQGCIDYASEHNGMAVYFPSGAYSVQSLTLKSEVSLFGFDRYSTKLVLRGGATSPMVLLNGNNCGIYNLTLDGNAGVQVENINVLSMIAQDVYLDGLILQNGYQLLVYNGTGGHLQINDVVFGNAVYRAVGISGNSVVQAKGVKFNQLSAVSGSDVITVASDGGSYEFISDVTCETCLSVSGNDNYFAGLVSGATHSFVDSGLRNTIDFKGNSKKEYYSGETDTTVEGNVEFTANGASDTTIKGDVGFTANSAYSENISGEYTSVRNNSESKVVNGNSVEQYNLSQTETIAKKKTINAEDIWLNPTNPLQYKTPSKYGQFFNSVEFKDENNTYNVLVGLNEYDTNILIANLNGLTGDGVTDDTESFNNLLSFSAGLSGKSVIVLDPSKTYLITGTLTWDIYKTMIRGNGATIKFVDNQSSARLFKIVNSFDYTKQQDFNEYYSGNTDASILGIDNIKIINNYTGDTPTATAFYFEGVPNTSAPTSYKYLAALSMLKFNGVVISGFHIGFHIYTMTYCISYFGGAMKCMNNVYIPNNGEDYYERISFFGTVFSGTARKSGSICVTINQPNGIVTMNGCSVDYCSEVASLTGSCKFFANNCHFEGETNGYWFIAYGSELGGTMISLSQCSIVFSGNATSPIFLVNTDVYEGGLFLNDIHLWFQHDVDTFMNKFNYNCIVNGTGRVVAKNINGFVGAGKINISESMSVLQNYDFESSTINDFEFTNAQYTTAEQHHGSQSLQINANGNATMIIPYTGSEKRVTASLWCKSAAGTNTYLSIKPMTAQKVEFGTELYIHCQGTGEWKAYEMNPQAPLPFGTHYLKISLVGDLNQVSYFDQVMINIF